MAKHSHFSNVKRKKNRNDKKKSNTFLKLRERIYLILKNEGELGQKKAFSLARDNNFSKRKIEIMIEKLFLKNKKNK
ncbi:MAG TPA: hypothetical protein VN854_01025 [Mycoplasmatales bacterium]|jgi:transcriptional/translational regulatory protein YebC/TACO1|nr:hypothetical protein [Mycoplasmatales bacterium]